jgi:hypothetical protein
MLRTSGVEGSRNTSGSFVRRVYDPARILPWRSGDDGWLQSIFALGVLAFVVWWSPGSLSVSLIIGCAAATVTFITSRLALRVWRRRLNRHADSSIAEKPSRRWIQRFDRIAGGWLGLVCSSLACLGFACLNSTLPLAYSIQAQSTTEQEEADAPPLWVTKLRETCITLTDLSDNSVLNHVQRLREYGQKMRSLVRILNAPPEDLKRVTELHGFGKLQSLPAVKAALDDHGYAELFLSLQKGDLSVISRLVDDPITHELIECREIRELTRPLTPSSLARDLDSSDSEIEVVSTDEQSSDVGVSH